MMGQERINHSKNTTKNSLHQATNNTKPSTHPILQLQADIGNAAVNHLIQAQHQGNQQPIQSKPLFGGLSQELLPIQPKLSIGTPGDKYEQEADHIAEEVVSQINTSGIQQSTPSQTVQRSVQPLSDGGGTVATPEQETSIEQAKGNGQPLPENIRQPMEEAFEADFSGVRIHTNAQSDEMNQSIQANAFTTGKDIFFRSDTFNPHTHQGQKLLAHELTHVVQQSGSQPQTQTSEKGDMSPVTAQTGSQMIQCQFTIDDQDWLERQNGQPVDISPLLTQKAATNAQAGVAQLGARPTGWRQRNARKNWDAQAKALRDTETRKQQFKSDTALWYHTLFDRGANMQQADATVLDQQQQLLKRHFLAMASLGVQSGSQKTGQYQQFQDPNVPLATLASHGGRFAYESDTLATGNQFFNLLMTGNTATAPNFDPLYNPSGTAPRPLDAATRGNNPSAADAGLFARRSTHPQDFKENRGRWKEKKSTSGTLAGTSLGMNIAMGGVGNISSANTTIGPEGAIINRQTGARTGGQHGHAFFKYDTHAASAADPGGSGRLMVGFEGSGPTYNSLVGAHGIMSAIQGNDRSLTGQSKADAVDLPHGRGALKADVTAGNIANLTNLFQDLETIHGSNSVLDKTQEASIFKQLLASTANNDVVLPNGATKRGRTYLLQQLSAIAQEIRDRDAHENDMMLLPADLFS
ncbi:MAG: DUF4157 domain-containing protein [Nostocaceae cyanobacterium]|nr:DUF4157 domain-containing protein [Nostocaceae cyanobacterium]